MAGREQVVATRLDDMEWRLLRITAEARDIPVATLLRQLVRTELEEVFPAIKFEHPVARQRYGYREHWRLADRDGGCNVLHEGVI